jgi:hypothetical protein
VLLVTFPAAAGANPSVDQYTESVPTADGQTRPHSGPDQTRPRPHRLPRSVRHRIQTEGGSDAPQLEAVAASPELGAPARADGTISDAGGAAGGSDRGDGGAGGDSGSTGNATGGSKAGADEPDRPSTLHAVTTAAASGDGGSVGVLLVGLLAITLAAAAAARARRRASR